MTAQSNFLIQNQKNNTLNNWTSKSINEDFNDKIFGKRAISNCSKLSNFQPKADNLISHMSVRKPVKSKSNRRVRGELNQNNNVDMKILNNIMDRMKVLRK